MRSSEVHAKLVEMFPEFAAYWDTSRNYHRRDDGSFTLWGLFAQFSQYVKERLRSPPASSLGNLGRFIEECMDSPGSDLHNAAATCFLENLAGEDFTPALAAHLGSRAKAFLSQ